MLWASIVSTTIIGSFKVINGFKMNTEYNWKFFLKIRYYKLKFEWYIYKYSLEILTSLVSKYQFIM